MTRIINQNQKSRKLGIDGLAFEGAEARHEVIFGIIVALVLDRALYRRKVTGGNYDGHSEAFIRAHDAAAGGFS
jgi:hypothetical protein